MCYLIAKKFGDTGCVALQTSHASIWLILKGG